jgi:hypothetical protein
MKKIRYYEINSKYTQDKLKFKLIRVYFSLITIVLLSLFLLSVFESNNKDIVKTVYIPNKIELEKVNSNKENINIVNNGTANITINNYYGNNNINEEKINGAVLFKIYTKDIIVLNNYLKEAIFFLDNFKNNKNCNIHAKSDLIENDRTFFQLDYIICENGYQENISGYILGEDAKKEVLLEKNHFNEISKDISVALLKGLLASINLNDKILTNLDLENSYFISKNRQFSLILDKSIGYCGGDYEFSEGNCVKKISSSEYNSLYILNKYKEELSK